MILHINGLGQTGLAITDHECLSGHVKFLKKVKELKKREIINNDFKPILGNEIYLVDEDEMSMDIQKGKSNYYHFLLLAKDAQGHEQLRKLSSTAWNRMFSYKGIERVPTFYTDIEEIVGNNKGHLIASTACLGSYFAKNVMMLLSEDVEDKQEYKRKIHEFVNWCIDVFGKENFYIEIQPSLMYEQVEYNKYAVKIAKAYGLGHTITTDAHYLKHEDREIHKAYLTSDEDGNGNREIDDFYSSTHFFTTEELFANMNYLDKEIVQEGIDNTIKIASQVEIYDLVNDQIIPKIKIPDSKDWYSNKEIEDIIARR